MYNTVLGAKPMHADGRAFYYADYNFAGKKVFSNHRFPCCSGTLPQVATDYGINTYFRDLRGIYVNLYIPSKVSWMQEGTSIAIEQSGDYPFDDHVSLTVAASSHRDFQIRLRVPEWAPAARVEINGKRWTGTPVAGEFASLSRQWRTGDRIDLQLPRENRLEPISPLRPDVVALLNGPLVLFAVSDTTPQLTRQQLRGVRQTSARRWEAQGSRGQQLFLPFMEIDAESYSTYLHVT